MPITLGPARYPQDTEFSRYVVLEWELHAYFRQLAAVDPDAAGLARLEPYGDSVFAAASLAGLRAQLEGLLARLAVRYEGPLPAELEPPPLVGLESEPDGEPCGRQGVLDFLRELRAICELARVSDGMVLAVGD